MTAPRVTVGATYLGDKRCRFLVWGPQVERLEVLLLQGSQRDGRHNMFDRAGALPAKQEVASLARREGGYYEAVVEGVEPGTRYLYRLHGRKELPDPASRYQPEGVHGASAVVDPAFPWKDRGWVGVPLHDYILYELHVGTFTPQGTFEAVIRRLDKLKELGVTALELMPVAQFPGLRNWGYDGVYPYAVQNSYGGPAGLKRLVNAAHQAGLAVVLDVVYNHVGPEGNHLGEFGPYFTQVHRTPWGRALNFAGRLCGGVRRFFIENALYWQTEFHIDAIHDSSAVPVLEELAEACHRQAERLKRRFYLIGESGLDTVRHIPGAAQVGPSLDAEWRDDFHHCLHGLLTREQTGYYARFTGVAQFARIWRAGNTGTGVPSAARNRRKKLRKGPPPVMPSVVYSQNHDQVGNRLQGERLAALVSFEALKLAAATVLLSPFIPLLFMGEEYGETAPFHYFISHSSPALIRAVRAGRRAELAASGWRGKSPNPQDDSSFARAKLNRVLVERPRHRLLHEFYRELIRLRQTVPVLAAASGSTMSVHAHGFEEVLLVNYSIGGHRVLAALNYSARLATVTAAASPGRWSALLDSASRQWEGPGSLVAEEFSSRGRVKLRLPAKSALVLESS